MSTKGKKETLKQEGEVTEEVVLTPETSQEKPETEVEMTEEVILKNETNTAKPAKETKAKEVKATNKQAKAEKPEETVQEVKDPVMDFEIDPNKTYEFRMKNPSFRYIIPSSATVYDEVDGSPRDIQLTQTNQSPFKDDHPENGKASSKTLSFVKGILKLKGTEAPAIRYLLAYDGYAGKKGILPGNKAIKGLYDLFVPEDEEAKKLERKKLKHKAETKVLEASDEDVSDFITSIQNQTLSGDFARTEALRICETNPELVLKGMDNPSIKIKAKLIKAMHKNLLAVVNGQVVSPTGKVLFTSTSSDVLLDAAKEIASSTAKGSLMTDVLAEV